MTETNVTVRCVNCKATKVVLAQSIPDNDVPYCDDCGSPMASESVEVITRPRK